MLISFKIKLTNPDGNLQLFNNAEKQAHLNKCQCILIYMGLLSMIFNRVGDIFGRPNLDLLVASHSKLLSKRNRSQAAVLGLKKRFDKEYNKFMRYIKNLITQGKISSKEYTTIERLCSGFLSLSSDEIEYEKHRAFEAVSISKDIPINSEILRLACIAEEIADKAEKIKKIDGEIADLQHEISRLRNSKIFK